MKRLHEVIRAENLLQPGETVEHLSATRHDCVFEEARRRLFETLEIVTGRNEDVAYSTVYVKMAARTTVHITTGKIKKRYREADAEDNV